MFDLRYHVASLAAVFLALVIGILVGIGIADTGVQEDALRREIARAEGERDRALERVGFLERQQKATQDFVASSYGALMAHRLDGRRIALVFVGSIDSDVGASVERTIDDADGRLTTMRALRVPIDRQAFQSALARRSLVTRYAGEDGLAALGHDLALALVDGDDTMLWEVLGKQLVEEQDGTLARPADGVVVARTAPPQHGPTGRFLNGFYAGLGDGGVPVVGVENTGAKTTAVGLFKRHGLSSVDDLDTATGRLAVALLLAGGEKGQYGLRETADGLMPAIEPLEPVD